jgi:hypothetical protein
VPAFERLQQQGKTRFLGLTTIGDTTALQRVIDARAFDSAQVSTICSIRQRPPNCRRNYPAQDYGRLFDHTTAAGVGVVGIRVLAGGALSGSTERHPIANPPPEPIGSAISYDAERCFGQACASSNCCGVAMPTMMVPTAECEIANRVARCIAICHTRPPVRAATHVRWRATVIAEG